jgi:prophage regulatory protein
VGQTTSTKPNFDDLSDDALIRLKDLVAFNVIPFSSTTIWRKIKARTFPEPKKISANIVAFRCGEIREWSRDPPNYVATQIKK